MNDTVKLSSASDRSQADWRMEVVGNWAMCTQRTRERGRDPQAPTRDKSKTQGSNLECEHFGLRCEKCSCFMKSRVRSELMPINICVRRKYA